MLRGATLLVAACAAAVAVAAAGCGGSDEGAGQPGPVRIGVVLDLTGPHTRTDLVALDGARLAVDRINARGGLLGRRVELLERDGQADPALAARATATLAGLGVVAVVGLSSDRDTDAAAAAAAARSVPFVASGATDPRLGAGHDGWLFMTAAADNALAAAAAGFARGRLEARRAAVVVAARDAASRRLAHYFGQSFRAQGGAVVATLRYREPAELTALRSGIGGDDWEEADVVYVACPRDDARSAVAAALAAGHGVPVIGPESLRAAGGRRRHGDDLRVYFTAQTLLDMEPIDPQLAAFAERFRAAYDQVPPDSHACLGYDAVMLVAAAVRAAGSVAPERVRQALAAMDAFAGVSGELAFDDDGVSRRPVVVARLGVPSRALYYGVPDHVPPP